MQTIFRDQLLQDQVIVITGGGSGIGLEIARQAGSLGARIAICGRTPAKLEGATAELTALGIDAWHATCDIRETDQVEAFVDGVLAHFGRIDGLVNNAGGQYPSPAQLVSPKGFAAVVRNNLLGTWTFIHTVANRAMLPQRSGRIVNITAQVSRGFPGMVHTGAARSGVENLTKTIAVEWAAHGVRTNAIAPGIIRSSGTDRYGEELLELGRQGTPMKRLGLPHEVAALAIYLLGPAADFITGQVLTIDGGQSLWGDMWQLPEEPL